MFTDMKEYDSRSPNKKIKKRQNRTNRRNGGRSNYTSSIAPLYGFIKPRELVTLKYFDVISITTTTLAVSPYVFRLNSLFDPDLTGTGHQPYGRDTLAAIFNRYRVYETAWKITIPSSSQTFSCLVLPSNGTYTGTTLADFTLATELPYAQYYTVGASGAPPAVFTGRVRLAQLGGTKKVEFESDDRFQANFSSNPTEIQNLVYMTYNPNGSSNVTQLNVELWFYAEVFDIINQAQS